MKKLFAVFAVILFSACLFAYDGTVYGGKDGIYVRRAWTVEASDPALARDLLIDAYKGQSESKITKFYLITKDLADAEDNQLIDDVEDFIDEEYNVEHKAGYSHIVIRNDNGNYVDGWLVLSHYTNADGFLHYIYYFCIE